MAFGVKIKNIKTKQPYSIESLFEAIKDRTFTAGTPSLTKNGLAFVITFPALDSQNQVWIMRSGFSAESQKFSIQKSQEAGVGNMAANMAIDELTGGLFGFKSVIGKNAKRCEELVEITAKEIEDLDL